MKGYTKAFIVAGVLFVIGLLFVIVGGIILGFDYDPFEKPIDGNYEVSYEDTIGKEITSLDLDMMACEITIRPSENEATKVLYKNAPIGLNVDSVVQGKTLTVKQTGSTVSLHFKSPKMEILLANSVKEINVQCNAGTVKIYNLTLDSISVQTDAGTVDLSSVNAEKMEIETSAGSVKLNSVDSTALEIETSMGSINGSRVSSDRLIATTSMGSINLQMTGAKADYTIKTDVSLGNSNVINQTGTTNKYLELTADLGSINVTFTK